MKKKFTTEYIGRFIEEYEKEVGLILTTDEAKELLGDYTNLIAKITKAISIIIQVALTDFIGCEKLKIPNQK